MLRRCAPALLPLLLLAGCSGSSSSGERAEGLPKAEFLAQAEKICANANTALDAEPEPTAPAGISPYFDTLVGIAADTTSRLEAVAAGQPDKAEVDEIFLTPLRAQVTTIEAYLPKAKAALAEGEEAFTSLPEPELPEADTAAMEEYGFDACVETAQAE